VFLDRHTGAPEWATAKTGLFGLKSSFVPIRDAELTGEGEVRIPFQKELVKNAPMVEADGELSAEEERRLWEHYGRSEYVADPDENAAIPAGSGGPREGADRNRTGVNGFAGRCVATPPRRRGGVPSVARVSGEGRRGSETR
jgi:hypothetical protein